MIVNAWKTDYLADPLMAFVNAIDEALEEHQEKYGSLADDAKKIVPDLAKAGVKLAPVVASFLSSMFAPEAEPAIRASADAAAGVGAELLERQRKLRTAEADFKEKLQEVRDLLTSRERLSRISRSVVIIVDELDRCRPDYAVKTLERIKHFFDVPGVVFVLATDGANLPQAVASVYGGTEAQAERYLRRFVDFEYELPPPSALGFAELLFHEYELTDLVEGINREALTRAREETYEVPGAYKNFLCKGRGTDVAEVMEAFPFIADRLRLSLRDQAQALNMLNAYIRTLSNSEKIFPQVVTFLCCLKFADHELYQSIKAGRTRLVSLNSQKILANGAPLGWLSPKTTIGGDLAVFIGALSVGSSGMASHIASQAHNNSLDIQMGAAFKRLYFRVETSDVADLVSKYERRSLRLVDAFAGQAKGER